MTMNTNMSIEHEHEHASGQHGRDSGQAGPDAATTVQVNMNALRKPFGYRLARTSGAFLAAVLITYVAAALFATQSVVARLQAMDIAIRLSERLAMSLQDLVGMAGMFLPIIAAGFAIALPIAALLTRLAPKRRTALYMLAGATALVAVHLGLQIAFDITPVAVARSTIGLLSQAIAGTLGGYCFARLTRTTAAAPV